MTKSWIGKSIVFIGIIHSLFGLVAFKFEVMQIINGGVINTVNTEVMKNLAFWFIYFGLFVIVFGFLIDWWKEPVSACPSFWDGLCLL